MRLDWSGVKNLWYRIDDIFARLTEAAQRLEWSSPNLTIKNCNGSTINTVDLSNGLSTEAETIGTVSYNTSTGYLNFTYVNGQSAGSFNLWGLITYAISQGTSGFVTLNTADDRYGASLNISGNQLQLISKDGTALDSVGILTLNTTDDRYGAKLQYNSSTHTLQLISKDGTELSSVTIS